jgi:hypothetical protein
MMFDDGQAVKLVPVVKIPGRGVIFDARGTEPLPDEFLPASQAFSLFSADDGGAGLGGVSLSHEVPSSIKWKTTSANPVPRRRKPGSLSG